MTICPKCRYQRLASDTAPDWQCPNCGVAYNKVAVSTTPSPRRQIEQEDTLDEENGSSKKIVFVLLLISLAGFGIWKYRHLPSGSSPMASGSRFDEARRAFENQNFVDATRDFTALAEAGDAKAQYYLGRIYALDWSATHMVSGKSVGQASDRKKSVYWFTKSAEQGELPAQLELAKLYENNLAGGDNPREESAKWYEKAAEQGDAGAQYKIGLFFYNGTGVEKDFSQAAKWYRLAAAQGHGEGLEGLGILYRDGEGVPANPTTAYKLFRLATARYRIDPTTGGLMAARRGEVVAKQLSSAELSEADTLAETWKPGQPLPQ